MLPDTFPTIRVGEFSLAFLEAPANPALLLPDSLLISVFRKEPRESELNPK